MIVRVLLIKGKKRMYPTEPAWLANKELWTSQGWRLAEDNEILSEVEKIEPEEDTAEIEVPTPKKTKAKKADKD